MVTQRGRESFSANDLPHGKRVTRKRLPTPFSRFQQQNIWPGAYYGYAAILEEEAVKAPFSSPPRCRDDFTCGLYVRLTDRRTA